jgi:hypothetical protein
MPIEPGPPAPPRSARRTISIPCRRVVVAVSGSIRSARSALALAARGRRGLGEDRGVGGGALGRRAGLHGLEPDHRGDGAVRRLRALGLRECGPRLAQRGEGTRHVAPPFPHLRQ